MYSTNTNHQQDDRQDVQPFKPDPHGYKYAITIEDVINKDGSQGIAIRINTVKRADHKTAAYYTTKIIDRTISSGLSTIMEAVTEALNNQKDKR